MCIYVCISIIPEKIGRDKILASLSSLQIPTVLCIAFGALNHACTAEIWFLFIQLATFSSNVCVARLQKCLYGKGNVDEHATPLKRRVREIIRQYPYCAAYFLKQKSKWRAVTNYGYRSSCVCNKRKSTVCMFTLLLWVSFLSNYRCPVVI